MLLIEETQRKIVTAKWAIINQASAMPVSKMKKISSKFLNKHFSDLLDDTEKVSPTSDTIDLLSSKEGVDAKVNKEDESSSSSSNSSDGDEDATCVLLIIRFFLLC
jgi:hypothetical protein